MLPSAQAIIFLLAADTGVTASDMAIWKRPGCECPKFVANFGH